MEQFIEQKALAEMVDDYESISYEPNQMITKYIEQVYHPIELQHEVIIADYSRVDIFIPDMNLIINFKGDSQINGLGNVKKDSLMKDKLFKHLGY